MYEGVSESTTSLAPIRIKLPVGTKPTPLRSRPMGGGRLPGRRRGDDGGNLAFTITGNVRVEHTASIAALKAAAARDADQCFYSHWMPLPAAPSAKGVCEVKALIRSDLPREILGFSHREACQFLSAGTGYGSAMRRRMVTAISRYNHRHIFAHRASYVAHWHDIPSSLAVLPQVRHPACRTQTICFWGRSRTTTKIVGRSAGTKGMERSRNSLADAVRKIRTPQFPTTKQSAYCGRVWRQPRAVYDMPWERPGGT